MTYQTNQQWQNKRRAALKRQLREALPTIKQCVAYMDNDCNYDFVGKLGRACYVFRDRTGKRPLHIREMTWTLGELRYAFNHGW
jgi:hypothetical protein